MHAHAAERHFPKQESPICQAQVAASWTPEKLIDLVWDYSSPLLMLKAQFSDHCPGQLVKPKKRRPRLYWEPFCPLQTAGRCFTVHAALIYDTCCCVGAYLLKLFWFVPFLSCLHMVCVCVYFANLLWQTWSRQTVLDHAVFGILFLIGTSQLKESKLPLKRYIPCLIGRIVSFRTKNINTQHTDLYRCYTWTKYFQLS